MILILRSRSSLLPRGSTPSGSEAPSWLLSPPSRRCGSPSRSTTRLVPELSTASASKKPFFCQQSPSLHRDISQRVSLSPSRCIYFFLLPLLLPLLLLLLPLLLFLLFLSKIPPK